MNKTDINGIKIATLNLNGETFYSVNRRPRLPKDLFDILRIKKDLIIRMENGLKRILENKEYDVIAIQELVYSQKERSIIEKIIEDNGYKLLIPQLGPNVHFTVGFIVNEDHVKECSLYEVSKLKRNKYAGIKCNIKNMQEVNIFNVHITDHSSEDNTIMEYISNYENESIILLGDMNSYTKEQIEDKGKESKNAGFINNLNNFFGNKNSNKNYTFYTGEKWRKLDHIFCSNKFIKNISSYAETKDDSVNFYSDNENGFTDHSMLVLQLKTKDSMTE